MSIQTYKARVAQTQQLSSTFHYLDFELLQPSTIEFQAGQYLMLTVPGIDQKRSYSIASKPSVNHKIELIVDDKPQGPGTSYLTSLKPGDEVEFMAPAGIFYLLPDEGISKRVYIATGSGITPLRSMLLTQLQDQHDLRETHLHWGLRHSEDMFWADDFHQLQEEFSNFHFDLVLSKASPDWPLCQGHVTDCLLKHFTDFSNTAYYLCGNTAMIKEVSQTLLEKGVEESNIHHEKFY